MKKIIATCAVVMVACSLHAARQLSSSDIEARSPFEITQEEALLLSLRERDSRNLALKEQDLSTATTLEKQGKTAEAGALLAEIRGRDMQLINDYKEFLEKYPRSYAAHNDLGNLYYDLGYVNEPYVHWLKAASINPDYAPAHNNIGVWHSHFGSSPRLAIQEAQRAIELGPQQASFHFNLATYCYTFRYVALEHFGCELPELFDIIIKAHKYSVELAPEDYDYAYNYAFTFFGHKLFKAALDWKEAEAAWLHLLKLRPLETRKVYRFLTMLAINAGYRPQAEQYMKLLKEVDPSDARDIQHLEERLRKLQDEQKKAQR
jgi:tetratricopeptide (TPR) repeat protein